MDTPRFGASVSVPGAIKLSLVGSVDSSWLSSSYLFRLLRMPTRTNSATATTTPPMIVGTSHVGSEVFDFDLVEDEEVGS